MEYTSELCLETIDYLVKAGTEDDSFSEAFPYLHHFKNSGGDASLKSFVDHCETHEIKGQTNTNVCRRLLSIKQMVDELKSTSTDVSDVTAIKFQKFAKKSVEITPF